MRYKIILAAIAATAGLAAATPALARDGCGTGWQRGVYGRCHPIKRASIVIAPVRPVIGVYYHRHVAIGTVAVIGPSATSTAAAGVIAKR